MAQTLSTLDQLVVASPRRKVTRVVTVAKVRAEWRGSVLAYQDWMRQGASTQAVSVDGCMSVVSHNMVKYQPAFAGHREQRSCGGQADRRGQRAGGSSTSSSPDAQGGHSCLLETCLCRDGPESRERCLPRSGGLARDGRARLLPDGGQASLAMAWLECVEAEVVDGQ